MAGTTVVVTGANSGLGFHTVRNLAQQKPLDLGSLASVRDYTQALRERTGPIIALVNNAGIGAAFPRKLSADGYEETFAVNYLGPFLLTLLLLPELRRGAALLGGESTARIVNVVSELHDPTSFPKKAAEAATWLPQWPAGDLAKLATEADPKGEGSMTASGRRYAESKLCQLLFTAELERRLNGTAITPLAFGPGFMAESGLHRAAGPVLSFLLWLLAPVARWALPHVASSLPKSGFGLAALATSSEWSRPSGSYLRVWGGTSVPRVYPSSALANDAPTQSALWDVSLRLAHVTEAELRAAGL